MGAVLGPGSLFFMFLFLQLPRLRRLDLPPLHFQGSVQTLSYFSNPTLTFLNLPPHVYSYTLLHSAHTDMHALSFGQLLGSLKAETKSHNVWPLVSNQTPPWLVVGLLHYRERGQTGSLSDGATFSWDLGHGEWILRPGRGAKGTDFTFSTSSLLCPSVNTPLLIILGEVIYRSQKSPVELF